MNNKQLSSLVCSSAKTLKQTIRRCKQISRNNSSHSKYSTSANTKQTLAQPNWKLVGNPKPLFGGKFIIYECEKETNGAKLLFVSNQEEETDRFELGILVRTPSTSPAPLAVLANTQLSQENPTIEKFIVPSKLSPINEFVFPSGRSVSIEDHHSRYYFRTSRWQSIENIMGSVSKALYGHLDSAFTVSDAQKKSFYQQVLGPILRPDEHSSQPQILLSSAQYQMMKQISCIDVPKALKQKTISELYSESEAAKYSSVGGIGEDYITGCLRDTPSLFDKTLEYRKQMYTPNNSLFYVYSGNKSVTLNTVLQSMESRNTAMHLSGGNPADFAKLFDKSMKRWSGQKVVSMKSGYEGPRFGEGVIGLGYLTQEMVDESPITRYKSKFVIDALTNPNGPIDLTFENDKSKIDYILESSNFTKKELYHDDSIVIGFSNAIPSDRTVQYINSVMDPMMEDIAKSGFHKNYIQLMCNTKQAILMRNSEYPFKLFGDAEGAWSIGGNTNTSITDKMMYTNFDALNNLLNDPKELNNFSMQYISKYIASETASKVVVKMELDKRWRDNTQKLENELLSSSYKRHPKFWKSILEHPQSNPEIAAVDLLPPESYIPRSSSVSFPEDKYQVQNYALPKLSAQVITSEKPKEDMLVEVTYIFGREEKIFGPSLIAMSYLSTLLHLFGARAMEPNQLHSTITANTIGGIDFKLMPTAEGKGQIAFQVAFAPKNAQKAMDLFNAFIFENEFTNKEMTAEDIETIKHCLLESGRNAAHNAGNDLEYTARIHTAAAVSVPSSLKSLIEGIANSSSTVQMFTEQKEFRARDHQERAIAATIEMIKELFAALVRDPSSFKAIISAPKEHVYAISQSAKRTINSIQSLRRKHTLNENIRNVNIEESLRGHSHYIKLPISYYSLCFSISVPPIGHDDSAALLVLASLMNIFPSMQGVDSFLATYQIDGSFSLQFNTVEDPQQSMQEVLTGLSIENIEYSLNDEMIEKAKLLALSFAGLSRIEPQYHTRLVNQACLLSSVTTTSFDNKSLSQVMSEYLEQVKKIDLEAMLQVYNKYFKQIDKKLYAFTVIGAEQFMPAYVKADHAKSLRRAEAEKKGLPLSPTDKDPPLWTVI